MIYNHRKIQILSIFQDSKLSAKEVYEQIPNYISYECLMTLLKRYSNFGLLERIKTKPFAYSITEKGIERLRYLRELELDKALKLLIPLINK